MSNTDWILSGEKDRQLVRSDWSTANAIAIDGVIAKQVGNVITSNGYLTEIWRPDWMLDAGSAGHVFQRVLEPHATSGWHVHRQTTDRLFCAMGRLLIALYDGRRSSATVGHVTDFRIGAERPGVVVIPPGVWHGVRNLGSTPLVMINVVDVAYDYEDPDHYRLPVDTPEIPYQL